LEKASSLPCHGALLSFSCLVFTMKAFSLPSQFFVIVFSKKLKSSSSSQTAIDWKWGLELYEKGGDAVLEIKNGQRKEPKLWIGWR